MKIKYIFCFLIGLFFSVLIKAETIDKNCHAYKKSSAIQWQKCYGGTSDDYIESRIPTADGGYLLYGFTSSNNGDVSGNHGAIDYWLVKVDSSGNIQWQKCYGGTSNEGMAPSVIQTTDEGYLLWDNGEYSNDGDISGYHGGKDSWLLKIDSSGNIMWQRCLGGASDDLIYSVIQTSDEGYSLRGETKSNDGDVSGNHGATDCWMLKLDSSGNIQWQKCYGGTSDDYIESRIPTADGGYLLYGFTSSNNGDVSGNHGAIDYWLVKVDSSGNIQWQKCYGGTSNEGMAPSVIQTTDEGYLLWDNGEYSNDGDISGYHGGKDSWLLKIDSSGNIMWQRCFGGTSDDLIYSVIQTSDGGYSLRGETKSNNGDVSGNHGATDCWMLKLYEQNINAYTISGTVSGAVQQGVILTLSGTASSTTTSGTDGTFIFVASDGSYTVTPSLSGYTFTPSNRTITISGKNVTGCDFVATKNPGIYSISGTVSGAIQTGVTITLSGALSSTTLSGADGSYSFTGLADGSYTVTPELSGYIFTPFSKEVSISGTNQTGVDFTTAAISIYGTISKPSFNASHKDAVKKINGTNVQYSTDKFTVQTTIQFPGAFDLTTIGESTGFTFDFGLYSFSGKLGNAKSKFNGTNGGSASFKITGNDEIKGKTVTVEKVDLRWDKKKKMTVKITGTPVSDSSTNVVDLSGKADGPVTGSIDTFFLTFNNAGARFAEGESLSYTGKKTTKTVKTFTLVDWSAKGKK